MRLVAKFAVAAQFVFVILSLSIGACAFAQSNTIGFPSVNSCPNNSPSIQPGTDPGIPGNWYNPKREGTGWDLYFTSDHSQIVVYWLTYNAQHQPVWLTNGGTSSHQTGSSGEDEFWAPLYKVTLANPGNSTDRIATQVGQVSLVFVPDSTTIAAIRWQWNVLSGSHDECIYNFYHADTSGGTGNTAVNESYTGTWYDTSQSGWGLDVGIGTYTSGNTSTTYEIDTAIIYDDNGQPTWMQGSIENPTSATNTISLNYTLSQYSGGYPTSNCSNNNNNACFVAYGSRGSVQRHFTSSSSGTATILASVTASLAGTYVSGTKYGVHWPNSGYTNPATITKASDIDYVAVNESNCEIPAGESTCPVVVSWSSSHTGARVYKRNLTTNVISTTALGSSYNGIYTDQLSDGDDVRYELHGNSSPAGPLLYQSAEVKATAAPGLPPLPSPVSDAVPTNNANTGALSGMAGTDGGSATYHIPIVIPPGRAGMQPNLALDYNSRSGDGIMGLGWTISGLSSIHRCPQTPEQDGATKGVSYTNSDRLCLDGQRLVPVSGNYGQANAVYRTEVDSYARIIQVGGDLTGSVTCFRVEEKDGRILHYGSVVNGTSPGTLTCASGGDGRVIPSGASAPLSWMLEKIQDHVGNNELYTYANYGNGEVLLEQIAYTGFGTGAGDRTVTFNYENRTSASSSATDESSSYLAGGLTMQTQALQSIVTKVGSTTARTYTPVYAASSYNERLLTTSIQECASLSGQTACHPSTTFSYNDDALNASANIAVKSLQNYGLAADPSYDPGSSLTPYFLSVAGDYDGDGTRESYFTIQDSNGTHPYLLQLTGDRQAHLAYYLAGTNLLPLFGENSDLDSSGRSEMVVQGSNPLQFAVWDHSLVARGTAATTTDPFVGVSSGISYDWTQQIYSEPKTIFVADLNGDGKPDVITIQPDSSCGTDSIGSYYGVFGYINTTTASVAPGGSLSFQTPTRLFCLTRTHDVAIPANYHIPAIDHIADFNGDGLPDFFMVNTGDDSDAGSFAGIYLTQAGGQSVSLINPLTCTTPGGRYDECSWQYGYAVHWMDVNGDGLEDFVIARPGQGAWHIRLNKGGGSLGAAIAVTPSTYAGLDTYAGGLSGSSFRYLNRLPVIDADGDGKSDIMVPTPGGGPTSFAQRMCTIQKITLTSQDGAACPASTSGNQPTQNSTTSSSVNCAVYQCSDAPNGGIDMPPYSGGAQDGLNFNYQWNGLPVFGVYNTNGSAQISPNSNADRSIYHLSMLKFVQTGAGSFTVKLVSTPFVSGLVDSVSRTDDLFGDGLTDLTTTVGCPDVMISNDAPPGEGDNWSYPECAAVNDGTYGPVNFVDGTPSSTFASEWALYANINQGAASSAIPSNLSALPGLSIDSDPNGYSLGLGLPVLPGLMNKAVNGFGDTAAWRYATLSVPASQDGIALYSVLSDNGSDPGYEDSRHFYFDSSMPVVTGMTQSSGTGANTGSRSAVYGYNQAMYNHWGRGFQGFRQIVSETAPSESSRRVRTTTVYNQKFPLTGKVASVTQMAPSTGQTFHQETYTYLCRVLTGTGESSQMTCPQGDSLGSYAPTGGHVFQPVLTAQAAQDNDLQTGTQSDHMSTDNTWDQYGNLTDQVITEGDDYESGNYANGQYVQTYTKETANAYNTPSGVDSPSASDWWLNKLNSSTVTKSIQYWNYSYALPDSSLAPSQTVETDFTWNADHTPATKTIQPGVTNQQSTTSYFYPSPSYGLPSQVTVSLPDVSSALSPTRTTQFTYTSNGTSASSDGYFVYTVKNPLNQTTTTQHETNDGQITRATDPNGVQRVTTYDPFGRPTEIQYLGNNGVGYQSPAYMSYAPCSNGSCSSGGANYAEDGNEADAAYKVTTVQDGYPTQVAWYDMLGRKIKTAHRGYDSRFIETLTDYDDVGSVLDESTPVYLGNTAYFTMYSYDALNRPTEKLVQASDMDSTDGDFETDYTYSGRKTTVVAHGSHIACPGSGGNLCITMYRSKDVLGQYTYVVDASIHATEYWAGALGNVVAIKSPEGDLTKARYNQLGQRTQSIDPDQGSWNFTYDALGELLTQTDARGVVTSVLGRDALGRVTQQEELPPATAVTGLDSNVVLDQWTYDPTYGKGELGTATRRRGSNRTSPASNPIVWQESYGYDSTTARPSTTATTITEGSAVTLNSAMSYDVYGRPATHTYPSNLTVQTLYGPYGQSGGLANADSGTIWWETTAMDAWDKVTGESYIDGTTGTVSDYASSGQQHVASWALGGSTIDSLSYGYDSFGNLKSQYRTAGSQSNTETYAYDSLQRLTSASRSGGSVSYGYTLDGNLSSKSDWASNYYYAAANSHTSNCGPHAVYQAGAYTYTCDANGNVIGGNTLTITYDGDNLARSVSRSGGASVQWAYDANGQLDYEYSASKGTRYFGPDGYEQVGSNDIHELGPIVVTRNGSTDTVTTSLRDRLGSTIDTIDNGAQVTTNTRAYGPFGAARNGDMSTRTHGTLNLADTIHGFTRHESADDVWLLHMGGRLYDYQLGRFLNVDPIIGNPLSSQSLNPYSYIGNNPLSGTDPTGYASVSITGCTPMTGSHICGADTGAKNGQTTYNGRVTSTNPNTGITTTTRFTVGISGGNVSFQQTGVSQSGARMGQGTKPVGNLDGSNNGESGIDNVERDPGQQQLHKVAKAGQTIAAVGEDVLNAVNPANPTNLALGLGGKLVAGTVLKAAAGPTMRQLEKAIDDLDKSIDAAYITESENVILKIGGRNPINSRYAGSIHPSGVSFSKAGFPDFSPYARASVELKGLSGNYNKDAALANKALGLTATPRGYVWHHVEDGRTMQLVPRDIHNRVPHTGGAAVIRAGEMQP